jgi:hypothetical protein
MMAEGSDKGRVVPNVDRAVSHNVATPTVVLIPAQFDAPRKAVPGAGGSSRYLLEDERIYIADRLPVGAAANPSLVILGGPRPESAGS